MARYSFIFLVFLCPSAAFSQATDLIISEYAEGSGNNKYLEIYNGTGAAVNLADYQLRFYANGASTPNNNVTLSGTLNNGTTIVYRNSAATIYGGTTVVNAAINFNGNDAMALFKISANAFVDVFGNIGCDPGTAWTSGSHSTLDRTLVRDADVCTGITTDPATSCPFPTLATEWSVSAQNTIANLGSHTMSCSAPLSVQLDFFNADANEEGALLTWRTLTEKNTDQFAVERADQSGEFATIQTIPCAGNSQTPIDYAYTDRSPEFGLNYYRLKQTDFDGTTVYSDIRTVEFDGTKPVVVFPNPAENGAFTIAVKEVDAFMLRLCSLSGETIALAPFAVEDGRFIVSGMAAGCYLLSYPTEMGQKTEKVIVR